MSDPSSHLLDISRALTPAHPNWPGDAPFQVHPGARIAQGDSVNTGRIDTSTHTGTHVDAPWHYGDAAPKLGDVPLTRYLGACRVMRVPPGAFVTPDVLDGLPDPLPPRLLLFTGQPAQWTAFPEDFTALAPDFVWAAARRGVRLIGTDAPSVDPLESKTLDAHQACLDTGILILEGLSLTGVAPGDYTLICLPLPLPDVDGSPARAILLPAGTLP